MQALQCYRPVACFGNALRHKRPRRKQEAVLSHMEVCRLLLVETQSLTLETWGAV